MENRYKTVLQPARPVAGFGAAQPPMAHAAMQQQAARAHMANAGVASKVLKNSTTLAVAHQNEPVVGAAADKRTVATFLMGFLAAWALLPENGEMPKPHVTLQF